LTEQIEGDSSKINLLMSEQEEMQRKLTEEMQTQLLETEDKLRSDREHKEREITRLKDQIKMGGESGEDKQKMLKQSIADVNAERDRLLEELNAFKAQIQKEKDELDAKNKALQKSIAGLNKDREALEETFRKRQANEYKNLANLRKDMHEHRKDMNSCKVFLNQVDMVYESEDLHITMEYETFEQKPEERVKSLSTACNDENVKLFDLTKQQKVVAATPKVRKAAPDGDQRKKPSKPASSAPIDKLGKSESKTVAKKPSSKK